MLNCWEFMKCGREAGGEKSHEVEICPASTDTSLNGINRGKNGGRSCWKVCGTLCGGENQGTIDSKFMDCMECPFLRSVMKEEGRNFSYLAP